MAQQGVTANPANPVTFSPDCNPYTTLEGISFTGPCNGATTSNGQWFSNVPNSSELWCADFAEWAWATAGVTSDLGTLTPSAASFYTWGEQHGENISFGGTPQVGDAVLFYPAGTSAPNGSYADHVGIVVGVNSDGSVNLINGDFTNGSSISVQYNTNVPGPSWYASGEQWAFVSPQLPTVPAAAGYLYQLHGNGSVFKYTGMPPTFWFQLPDTASNTAQVVANDTHVYERQANGNIFEYTGLGPTYWLQLDNNAKTTQIAASNGQLYQLHSDGSIFRNTGTPLTGWQRLDNNPATTAIITGPTRTTHR